VIQIWTDGESIWGPTVLAHSYDLDSLTHAVSGLQNQEVSAYALTPNSDKYIHLVFCLLAFKHDEKWHQTQNERFPSEAISVAELCYRLVSSLSTWDDRGALSAASGLLTLECKLHPAQVEFIKLIKSMLEDVIRPFLWGSPIQMNWPPSHAYKQWWNLNSSLSKSIKTINSDLKAIFGGKTPQVFMGLSMWLTHLADQFNNRLFVTGDASKATLEASALCYSLATIHYSQGRYSISTLLCHRAAELMFISMNADSGLIDFTKSGGEGELKSAVNGETRLSLLNCHDALVQASILTSNSLRRQELNDINITRNRLMLTHSLGSPTSSDTKSRLTQVHNILKAQGGTDWEKSVSNYKTKVPLRSIDFFEGFDAIAQGVRKL